MHRAVMDANGSVDRAESQFFIGLSLRLLMAIVICCTVFHLCRKSNCNKSNFLRAIFKKKKFSVCRLYIHVYAYL